MPSGLVIVTSRDPDAAFRLILTVTTSSLLLLNLIFCTAMPAPKSAVAPSAKLDPATLKLGEGRLGNVG